MNDQTDQIDSRNSLSVLRSKNDIPKQTRMGFSQFSRSAESINGQANNMPKSKKRKAPAPRDPDEFLACVREKSGKHLKSSAKKDKDANYDVEHNIRTIRALLVTNQEIWDRVNNHLDFDSEDFNGKNGNIVVWNYDFADVQAFTDPDTDKTTLTIDPNYNLVDANVKSLLHLPPKLVQVFAPSYEKDFSFIIDFESYFEKALMLHDDVLGPFLFHLKKHLESVQVCLGEIDSWLMETVGATAFVESLFDIDLSSFHLEEGKQIVLLECDSGGGTYEQDFNVEDESGREKLRKFIEFLTM